jgi:RNA polymerase nonessential primary-like sigma factor
MARPLLTAAEERACGFAVRRLGVIEARRAALTEEAGRSPSESELAAAAGCPDVPFLRRELADGRGARSAMILSNLRLVVAIARRTRASLPRTTATAVDRDGGSSRLDDLVAEGTLGLAVAVDRFEPERGLRFSTYATWWVRQAVQKAVRTRSVVRVPMHVQQLQKKADNATAFLRDTSGLAPTRAAVADLLGVSEKRLAAAERARETRPVSLDAALGRGQGAKGSGAGEAGSYGATLADLVESGDPRPEDCASFEELRESLADAMRTALGPDERDVLRLRLGLDDGARRTRREVGAICGASVKEVRQIERKALTRLRHTETCRALRGYCDITDGALDGE